MEGNSRAEQIDALTDLNRHYKQEYIEQSAIIYQYNDGDKNIRMTSQTFPFNDSTLELNIESKKLFLYVNRFDKNDYIFDMVN